jgi:acyl carrier protein
MPKAAASVPPAAVGAPTTERLAALWTEVLGIAAIRPGDDFFELGGNSLVAVELITRIRETFGVPVSIVTIFDHTRLDELARVLTEQQGR